MFRPLFLILRGYKDSFAIPWGLAGMILLGTLLTAWRWFDPFLPSRPNLFSILQSLFHQRPMNEYYQIIMALEAGILGSIFGFVFGFYFGVKVPRKRT
jgi:hypothetical protein